MGQWAGVRLLLVDRRSRPRVSGRGGWAAVSPLASPTNTDGRDGRGLSGSRKRPVVHTTSGWSGLATGAGPYTKATVTSLGHTGATVLLLGYCVMHDTRNTSRNTNTCGKHLKGRQCCFPGDHTMTRTPKQSTVYFSVEMLCKAHRIIPCQIVVFINNITNWSKDSLVKCTK